MKQRGYKYLRVICLLLAVMLTCAGAASIIFALKERKDTLEPLEVASVTGYDFLNGAIKGSSDSNYKNNTSFIISNKRGLNNFAASVNDACVDFAGKTVRLTKSIEYDRYYETSFAGVGVNPSGSNYKQRCFSGTFDGQGHTISYIQISHSGLYVYSEWEPYRFDDYLSPVGLGFFAGLSGNAKVQNLRIKDAIYRARDWRGPGIDQLHIGGIAGYIYGDGATNVQIANCSVENLTLDNMGVSENEREGIGLVGATNGTDVNRYIGGIVGKSSKYANLTVSNCYVSGLKSYIHKYPRFVDHIVQGTNNFVLDAAGAFVGDVRNDNAIINCVFDEKDSFCFYNPTFSYNFKDDDPYKDYYPTNPKQFLHAHGWYGYKIADNAVGSGVYVFTTDQRYGHGNTDTSFTSLTNKSAIGEQSSPAWYYAPTYNIYPVLRQFIAWRTIRFKATNGSVDPTSIAIPNDATLPLASKLIGLEICNRKITATGVHEYTTFVEWTYNSDESTYTANFDITYCLVSFIEPENKSSVTINKHAIHFGEQFHVAPGTDSGFAYSITTYPNGEIKSITYTFKDIYNYDKSITYTANDDYYLDFIDEFKTTTIDDDLLNITVAVIPKDYNLGII